MTMRTTKSSVTFTRPFNLTGFAGVLPIAVINPDELAAALAADAARTPDGDEFATWRALNMPGAADPKS